MRLDAFLLYDMEGILSDWEAFAAAQLPAAREMPALELRDHAREILQAVAHDLRTAQSRLQQSDKSKGLAPVLGGAPETAAQTHAVLRARSGFDINQLVAEYRALRASVLRRWLESLPHDQLILEDMVRFNEAIDQAVAESVSFFHDRVERARDLLLGMLGHDMRSPLNTIVVTAAHLAKLNAGEAVSAAAARLIRSGASMQALLDDLVDFNRTRLGLGIKVSPSEVDLAQVLNGEIEQWRGAYPERRIEVSMPRSLLGCWDGPRLQQVIRNLLLNAIRYGSATEPIRLEVRDERSGISIDVSNSGPPIEQSTLADLFEPLKRGPVIGTAKPAEDGLGLGLFIVREIVNAHGGEVTVESGPSQTTFALRLPR